MGKQWKQLQTIFLGSKITADGGRSYEIKRWLLLGRKAMTNLESILKSRDITLSTKIHLVKGIVFPLVMYRCETWAVKKAECQRIDTFELWYWRSLESPLECKEIKPVHPKGNQSWIFIGKTDVEAEALLCWADAKSGFLGKDLMLGKIEVGRTGNDRGQNGETASPPQWTWVWANSRRS